MLNFSIGIENTFRGAYTHIVESGYSVGFCRHEQSALLVDYITLLYLHIFLPQYRRIVEICLLVLLFLRYFQYTLLAYVIGKI